MNFQKWGLFSGSPGRIMIEHMEALNEKELDILLYLQEICTYKNLLK